MSKHSQIGNQIDASQENFGFGKSFSRSHNRMINDEGKFNILRMGETSRSRFHELITMKWSRFLLLIFLYYTFINLFFGLLYYINGSNQISGIDHSSIVSEFYQCFFFSVQTFTTVGYGGMHPIGFLASSIAGLEALSGLLTFAIITGLVYAKFSKPEAKIIYSDHLLVAPFKDGMSIQVRMVNAMNNTLIDMEATLIVAYTPLNSSNRIIRTLPLELNKIAMFPLNWTIVHAIDENSPLRNLDLKFPEHYEIEVLVLVRGFDETYNQIVHSMHSFGFNDFVYNAKFKPMYEYSDGKTRLYLKRLDEYEELM
jgi:inward rectifier potassium channel